jgi:hypothetical protein
VSSRIRYPTQVEKGYLTPRNSLNAIQQLPQNPITRVRDLSGVLGLVRSSGIIPSRILIACSDGAEHFTHSIVSPIHSWSKAMFHVANTHDALRSLDQAATSRDILQHYYKFRA